MTTAQRSAIVAEARSWLGTPFHHQGRVRGVGCDCVGLLIGVARAVGLVAPDFDVTGYARSPNGKSLLDACDRHLERIARADMRPGDVLVIRWLHDPQHVGIIGNHLHAGLSVIHAYGTPDGRGSTIEHRLDDGMARRYVAAYRFPGVAP